MLTMVDADGAPTRYASMQIRLQILMPKKLIQTVYKDKRPANQTKQTKSATRKLRLRRHTAASGQPEEREHR